MATFSNINDKAMGYSNAVQSLAPAPIIARRDPLASDKAALGQLWINKVTNGVWINAGFVAGVTTWNSLVAGGTGAFTNITVAGTSTLTGAVTMGSTLAVTGLSTLTGGATTPANLVTTGAGSITSNTTITAGTGITATTGNITATVGQVIAGGDTAGIAATTSLTNATQAPGAIANTLVGTNGGQTNDGYLKFYVGVNAVYVPYFNAP